MTLSVGIASWMARSILADLAWMLCVFCDPGPFQCYDACDINDDGIHSIGDAVFLINYLFEDGLAPLAPFPACGPDTTADGLTCVSYQYDCVSPPTLPPFEPGYTLSIPPAYGSPGETISTSVNLNIDESGIRMAACTFGVSHDPADLSFVSVLEGIDTTEVDFFMVQAHDDGWSCLIILSIVGSYTYADGDYQLATAQYQVLGEIGDTTNLEFSDSLGNPPIKTHIVDNSGWTEAIPAMVGNTLTVTRAFSRGDTNSDGRVDIGDPVWNLLCLFSCLPSCFDAHDTNDDGLWNIADPITTLSYLFNGGFPLPPPFLTCGADPTPDSLDCESYTCP